MGDRGARDPAPATPTTDPPRPLTEQAAAPSKPAGPTTPERARRDALRNKIAEAEHRDPGSRTPASNNPRLDREYIQSRIKDDLVPLAKECYENALADDPKLAGKLAMSFTIVGAEDVGGVVEDVALDESSTITAPGLVECMTESMMTVTFVPPPDDGAVTVTYPFIFVADDRG